MNRMKPCGIHAPFAKGNRQQHNGPRTRTTGFSPSEKAETDQPLDFAASSMAFNSPRALLSVSFHSFCGTLSATMPAPACT